ncbi:16S rRNA (uracil(1498)-N(3))-methyltransferase [Pinirhizobacter sp.]|jgi:16S rRNA (uracil1498-N3)-methyltransferase|uniref:16S rRNA (uracil(1498)-N(3))-methyltransferase n=1 Tax=Pinirhizobacter sp. TaxID=2950432 RepID=UPI002F3FFBC1
MRTIRVHVEQTLAAGSEAIITGQAVDHVGRVLRMQAGDAITLFNGDGNQYAGRLVEAGKKELRVAVESTTPAGNESPLPLVLVQGVARGDKMDFIMQKATELGVAGIVPVTCERSEVKLDAGRAKKRRAHWQAVVVGACEQSGRALVPVVWPTMALSTWLVSLEDDGRQRVALMPGVGRRVGELALGSPGAYLVVGPEGGLGQRDTEALASAGFMGLQLGPRILRTETAGLAALAALQSLYGDW